jgi:hypothetical protein
MEEAAAHSIQPKEDKPPASGEVNQWMRYFGVAPEDDEDESPDEML